MGWLTAAQRKELEDGNRYCNVDGYRHCGGYRADSGDYSDVQEMIVPQNASSRLPGRLPISPAARTSSRSI